MQQLIKIAARGRMAYSLACLESLTARLNYTSPMFNELLDLLWSFTETKDYGEWNRRVLKDKWGNYFFYGLWLGTEGTQGGPISKSDPFADAPQAVVGMMGLCALIGESHLYGAFSSDDSEAYLEQVLCIMDNHGIPLPPLHPFQRNSVSEVRGMGFPAPRSFYMRFR